MGKWYKWHKYFWMCCGYLFWSSQLLIFWKHPWKRNILNRWYSFWNNAKRIFITRLRFLSEFDRLLYFWYIENSGNNGWIKSLNNFTWWCIYKIFLLSFWLWLKLSNVGIKFAFKRICRNRKIKRCYLGICAYNDYHFHYKCCSFFCFKNQIAKKNEALIIQKV